MTQEEAFKRAVVWIDILLGAMDIDPDETAARFSVEGKTLVDANLGDDLREFNALGAAGWPEIREEGFDQ